jgi:hypothetical protein
MTAEKMYHINSTQILLHVITYAEKLGIDMFHPLECESSHTNSICEFQMIVLYEVMAITNKFQRKACHQ